MSFFKNIADSFNNNPGTGWSGRKLTAFTVTCMVIYCHLKYIDKDNVVEVLIIDFIAIGFLLGLVTFEQILKFKNGTAQPDNNNPV